MIGVDARDAAHLALGIGELQSKHRRVAICDLVGDVPPLQSLVSQEDPHGIVDAFQYGVSINKIAYQVGGVGNLFIMPSGTEPVVDEEILRHDRWRRLSGGFREVGALLLLVARADAPGLEDLIAKTDGIIMAGEPPLPGKPVVIASAQPPRKSRPARASTRVTQRKTARRLRSHLAPPAERAAWIVPVTAAIVVLAVAVAAFWWWRSRTASAAAEVPVDTVAADTFAASDAAPLVAPSLGDDPADSVRAMAWSVELAKLNTLSGAILKLDAEATRLPAVTYAPTLLGPDGDRWYVILAGAFFERSEADSLLSDIRRRAFVAEDVGQVVRLPYALLLEEQVTRATAPAVVRAYRARDLPAYALLQENGSTRIYAGAFESADQAADLAATFEQAGLHPVLVYRIGRPF